MSKYIYNGPEQYRPLSPWAYFGYSLLFSIPVIGLIFLLIYSFDDSRINRRNFARSYFCVIALVLIISGILAVTGVAGAFLSALPWA